MRLIDADGLLDEAENGGWDVDIKELKMILKYTPTVNPPVVRSNWDTYSYLPDTLICRKCGYKEDMWWADKGTNFCPNCGARNEGGLNAFIRRRNQEQLT